MKINYQDILKTKALLLVLLLGLTSGNAQESDKHLLNYPYKPYLESKMDPQLSGWPLTTAELTYVAKDVSLRRPGSENGTQKIEYLPYTPAADGNGNPNWYVTAHGSIIAMIDKYKKEFASYLDILLIGNSITFQWLENSDYGAYPQPFKNVWSSEFGKYKTVNIGIGGDKTNGVLWRLDHNGAEGNEGLPLKPRLVILEIGHNNLFYTLETNTKNAAIGIQWCIKNIRNRFPEAHIIVCKIFPCFYPEHRFYKDARDVNAELDSLIARENDSKVYLMQDVWAQMTHPDGTLVTRYFNNDRVHLTNEGYQVWAKNLKPLLKHLLDRGKIY
jgi:platelet-activating factor acetylhydrolase IB subunit beta/gamma